MKPDTPKQLQAEDREPSMAFVPRTVDVDELFVIEALAAGIPITKEIVEEWHAYIQLEVNKLWQHRAEHFLMAYREAHRKLPTESLGVTAKKLPPKDL